MAGPADAWLGRRGPEIKLSLRITIAGLLTYAIAELLGLAQGYWAVLTAVIVMQASVGGALKAMLDRLVATVGGALWGVAVAVAIPHAAALSTGIALAAALVPLAFLVAFRPAYRVAPVTAIIVLLASRTSIFESGIDRVLEISLGTVVALCVALFISPSRAQALLLDTARDALDAMGELIALLLGASPEPAEATAIGRYHDRIRGAIERAATQAEEAARERAIHTTSAPDPEPLVRTLRRLSHDLVMLGRARFTALPEPLLGRLAEPAAHVSATIANALAAMGAALVAGEPSPTFDDVTAALRDYAAAMAGVRRERLTRELPDDIVGQVFGLAFALEQLHRDLDELGSRTGELAQSPPRRRLFGARVRSPEGG